MLLDALYDAYRTGGYTAARAIPAPEALDQFMLALLAFNADAFAEALSFARAAAQREPGSRVYTQAVTYLERVVAHGKAGVYVDGDAFAAFIRGGGNVGLYAAVSAALRAVYAEYKALTLLDVGVGDGMALLPALSPAITRLDLVEPSAAMLGRTTSALESQGVRHCAYAQTVQEFIAAPAMQHTRWDVIQATWSLQSIPPAARPPIFAWLRAHCDRLLIAEFDVPAFAALFAPERVRYVVERYERGLAEYDGDGGVVAQGFLIPVLFGYFDQSAARTNWEGPLGEWIDGLRAAGFAQVEARPLYAYFWADAALIDAR